MGKEISYMSTKTKETSNEKTEYKEKLKLDNNHRYKVYKIILWVDLSVGV